MGDGEIHNSDSDLTLRPGERVDTDMVQDKEVKEFKEDVCADQTDTETRWTGADLERKCTGESFVGFTPVPLTPDVGPPPDGGWEAWNCAVSASFVTFCLMGFGKKRACVQNLIPVCSFGQLQEFYLSHQLLGYAKSTSA